MNFYRRHILVALCVLLAGMPSFALAQNASRVGQGQRFFQALNDVPLMPGLYEMLEDSVVFDKPEGRIAESAAATEKLAGEEIRHYYRETLPQLGWDPAGGDTFTRAGESLTLRIENQDGYNIVRFMVAPR